VVRSTDPLDSSIVANTVVDGNRAGPVVTFSGTEDETCVLAGFTVRNGASADGGGIKGGTPLRQTHATIRNNVITQNYAPSGAGLCGCDGLIENNTVSENGDWQGGGFYGCDGTIRNNRITANSISHEGGGLYGCHGTIQGNTIAGNAASDGGALYDCDGIIENNLISDNSAVGGGGGLSRCDGMIRNNLIAGNSGRWGGGLNESQGAAIMNNTIVDNGAWHGGGLLNCGGTIANCVIWGNTAPDGPQYAAQDPTHSCVQGWTGDERNTAQDPRFVDPDGPDGDPYTYEDNDYRLLADSPCIDAGINEAWMWEAVDLDGNSRIFPARSDRSWKVDMGAYEYIPADYPLTAFIRNTGTGVQILWTSHPGDSFVLLSCDGTLTGVWCEQATGILSTNVTTTWVDIAPETQARFYRAEQK